MADQRRRRSSVNHKKKEPFLKRFCKCICPCLYPKNDENKYMNLSNVIYGFFLGVLFYEMILIDLDFTPYSAIIAGFCMCLMLAISISVSRQIRCIAYLSLPIIAGKAGRGVLKAIVIAYIIAGPLANTGNNARDVARVFSCTTSLTFNLTKSRFELMFKPFQKALFGMKSDANDIKDTISSIRDITSPIAGELEGEEEMKKIKEENDYLDELQHDSKRSDEINKKYNTDGEKIEAERIRKNYMKKIESRCQDQLTRAGNKCRKMFATAYDKCYDKVTWVAAWILCWPMKLTFVCNIIEAIGGAKTCDPAQDVDPGFGEGYNYLKNSKSQLVHNFKDVKLQYKIGKIKELQDVRDAAESAKMVLHEVKKKKTILDTFFKILKRILAFLFLKVILNSQSYHDSYLRDIEFDNIYITKYFRKIDARRKMKEKHTLLPLKKIERLKIIDPLSVKPLKSEREEMTGQTILLLLEIISTIIFLLLDRLFYEILDIIRRHARIDYTQTGHHDLSLEVQGTGMIASLLRNVVSGFNVKKRIKVVRSNAQCLPRPTLLPNYYLFKIFGTYFAIWLMIVGQGYIQRLRRVICAHFYRKREKKRILFLYNETLKRRIGYFRYMRKKVKQMVREQRLEEDLNFFNILRIRFPKKFEWLRIFPMARRKCIICSEPEPYKKKNIRGNFTKCPNPTCYVVYCLECWYDVYEKCYACAVDSEDTDFADSDSDVNYD